MLKQDLEESNGGRTVVGIDPCSEFLQLAILTPKKKTEFKKLPLSPSITEEIVKSTDPRTTQIAIESYGSYGKLFIYDLLKMRIIAFITDYPVVDRILNHLKLTFVADKPPPPRIAYQEVLMAVETSAEYINIC